MRLFFIVWACQDSNLEPDVYKTSALPIELHALILV